MCCEIFKIFNIIFIVYLFIYFKLKLKFWYFFMKYYILRNIIKMHSSNQEEINNKENCAISKTDTTPELNAN